MNSVYSLCKNLWAYGIQIYDRGNIILRFTFPHHADDKKATILRISRFIMQFYIFYTERHYVVRIIFRSLLSPDYFDLL